MQMNLCNSFSVIAYTVGATYKEQKKALCVFSCLSLSAATRILCRDLQRDVDCPTALKLIMEYTALFNLSQRSSALRM